MEQYTYDDLNNMQIDVLKELGNIGAGNAVTALSSLINQKVDMATPKVNILDFKDVANVLGGEERQVAAVLLNVTGDVNGIMMFVLDIADATRLVNLLMGMESTDDKLSEMQISALQEIGNIIAGAYLNSLAQLTNKKMIASVPYLAMDMAAAILSVPAIEFGKIGDTVLLIQTDFGDEVDKVQGYFLFVPDIDSINIVLGSLGVI
ncbi:chemotaxis protein CheC [Vallitalea okinawensis]|uniref:chemotaxis protein CheC n=1 Tax=Vallitalea okinawensis TaxID=2078660 RepID=UPI000CFABCFB|nr:chemotaxis protein CheC [Vallitalea okinawensis]